MSNFRNKMLETENKLGLAALFTSVGIIVLALCYSIIQETTISIYFFVFIILISALVGVLISRTINPYIVGFFVGVLELFMSRKIDVLEKQVNEQQIENRKTDIFIKQRPVLYALVIASIVIVSGIFTAIFYFQILQLIR